MSLILSVTYNPLMLSVIMLNVVGLSVVRLSVIMLNVVVPFSEVFYFSVANWESSFVTLDFS